MIDYKELAEELRDKACNSKGYDRELCNRAADAIEQLIIDSEDYKEILFSCQEELKQAQAKCEDIEATLDTEIEYCNELKRKINSLKHNGYYTGTYIQSLIESEERNSDWKDEESVTFFTANKEV